MGLLALLIFATLFHIHKHRSAYGGYSGGFQRWVRTPQCDLN
jgi:hypothetical protein